MTEPTVQQWDYIVHVVKNPQIGELRSDLKRLGQGGWELVSITSTVKTIVNLSGNDLVLTFKRKLALEADLSIRSVEDYEPGTGLPKDEGYIGA